MNNLTVTVAGAPGTGKSALCQIIRKALKDNGFDVRFDGELCIPEMLRTRVESIQDAGTRVFVEEQTRRKS